MPDLPYDPRYQCTATSKQSGQRCRRRAAPGCDVCMMHGGRSPNAVEALGRRVEEARVREAVATYGLPIEVDPLDALLQELARTAGHVAWLGELVGSLEHHDDPEPTVLGNGGDRDPSEPHVSRSGLKQYTRTEKFTVEQESVWVRMYRDERKHLASVAAACLKAGVDERRVRLEQAKADQLAAVLREFARLNGLDIGSPEVAASARRAFSVIAGGAAA